MRERIHIFAKRGDVSRVVRSFVNTGVNRDYKSFTLTECRGNILYKGAKVAVQGWIGYVPNQMRPPMWFSLEPGN